MSSHSRQPRSYHDMEKDQLSDGIRRLTHIGEIVTSIMDDLLEAQRLPLHGIVPDDLIIDEELDDFVG